MSPVEQVALRVNIALRREAATLDYDQAGSSPDAFATLPKEWTRDQIRSWASRGWSSFHVGDDGLDPLQQA